MCMSTVTWQAESIKKAKSPTKWQKGYKIFKVTTSYADDNPTVRFPFYNLGNDDKVQLDTVLKAQSTKRKYNYATNQYEDTKENVLIGAHLPNESDTAKYLAGFHIFPVKMAGHLFLSTEWSKFLFEVEYRKVTAEGTHAIHTEYPADCVIAQEMKVIRKLTDQEIEELKQTQKEVENIKKRAAKRDKRARARRA